MEYLRFIKRNEHKFYCFIEVCLSIFQNTPKSTVRNWVKTLQIPTVICSAEERVFFRTGNPTLAGSFGLISADDLQRLIDYRSTPNKRTRYAETQSISTSSTTCTSPNNLNHTQPSLAKSRNAPSSVSFVETPCGNAEQCSNAVDQPIVVDYSDSSAEEEQDKHAVKLIVPSTSQECQTEESVDLSASSPVRKRRRSISVLSLEDAPQKLRTEIRSLREYYEKNFNPVRCGPPFSKSTADKTVERAMGFMFYCLNIENISDLSLSLFNDTNLYTKYIEYVRNVRKVKPSTIVNYLTVAINIVKYNLKKHDAAADLEKAPQIHAYRGYTRQFQRESYQLAKCAKEGLSKKSTQQFYFAHVLETLRNLRDKYFESSGLTKARHLHNFVLLALYMRALPGRSKEIRTLQLYVESEKRESFDFSHFESGNFIVFELGQSVYIIQTDFKTSKSTGPTKIDISDDLELVRYLQLFIEVRPSLMLGKTHDYFFLNRNGQPFQCSSAIAKYIGDIFEREVSIRVSTTALRHALVTYFCSIDESKDVNVRKSLAILMKHSLRYQETVYNDQSYDEKTKASRNLLRDKLARDVFGERDEIFHEQDIENSSDADSSEEVELKPEAGDIVALLDSASTKDNIEFFLAKVARFTEDRGDAHLLHLELVESSDNLYRLKPGRVWREPVEALIFPVDIFYDSSQKAYELRTSAEEIFRCVHGN